jgi:predicted nucleotidyltransferase component of viral defense system
MIYNSGCKDLVDTSSDITAFQRENIQAQLLMELFAQSARRELILKGGMAMRAAHDSVRFTKDIDLDANPEIDKSRIQGIVKRAIDATLSYGGLENAKVTAPKQTDTTMRWKINGTLAGGTSHINLTIEISRRGNTAMDHVVSKPLYFVGGPAVRPVAVHSIDAEAMAVSKVFALTSPNRSAPRDLWDLAMLIDMEVKPAPELFLRHGVAAIQEALNNLWQKVDGFTWAQFQQEVLPTLPLSVRGTVDEQLFSSMQLKVGERVSAWLEETFSAIPTSAETAGPETTVNEAPVGAPKVRP